MANTKISALTSLTGSGTDTTADVMPIVDASAGPATKKIVEYQDTWGKHTVKILPDGRIFSSGGLSIFDPKTNAFTHIPEVPSAYGVDLDSKGNIWFTENIREGKIGKVDPATLTLTTEFGAHKAAVANVIPPQQAGAIARKAGVADRTGWCPVEPVAFRSTLQPTIHVIGDATIEITGQRITRIASGASTSAREGIDAHGMGAMPGRHLYRGCHGFVRNRADSLSGTGIFRDHARGGGRAGRRRPAQAVPRHNGSWGGWAFPRRRGRSRSCRRARRRGRS